jgi:ligand-binding sensor domain-containing protein
MLGRVRPTIGVVLLAGLLADAPPIHGQQVALKRFTAAAGLASGVVTAIQQDRFGYLWIATYEGVSRFDGYRFENYGAADGLKVQLANDVVEDNRGQIWIATNGAGLARFNPQRKFETFAVGPGAPNHVNAMAAGPDGAIWCATDGGVFRSTLDASGDLSFAPVNGLQGAQASSAEIDGDNHAWLALPGTGVFEVLPEDGRLVRHTIPGRPLRIATRGQRVVVASDAGVFERMAGREWAKLSLHWLRNEQPAAVLIDSYGDVWIGTTLGLLRQRHGVFERYGLNNGLPEGLVRGLLEDRDGSIWIGSGGGGLAAVRQDTVVSFTIREGLPGSDIAWVSHGSDARVYGATRDDGLFEVNGTLLRALPGSAVEPFKTLSKPVASGAAWWALGRGRLYRFRGRELDLAGAQSVGLPAAEMCPASSRSCFTTDASGQLWFGTREPALYRFDPNGPWPPIFSRVPVAGIGADGFAPGAVTRAGAVWGSNIVTLARVDLAGRATVMQPPDREWQPRTMLLDSANRLWVGLRFGGLLRIDDPDAPAPSFKSMTVSDGLSSDAIWSIAEGAGGTLYLCTGRGVDILEVQTGRISHLSSADGLASDLTRFCSLDTQKRVWVATAGGLSRVDSTRVAARRDAPAVYLSRVRIAGEEIDLADGSTPGKAALTLSPNRNNLMIEYVGLRPAQPHLLRYQHRLIGAEDEWSTPGQNREVTYAQLGPGRYRFEVRAVDEHGTMSVTPAALAFEIQPQIWRRGWFITLAIATVVGVMWQFHRLRLQHAVAVERVRQQVEADLHDELGSGLTQIAILSEVARRNLPPAHAGVLDQTATLARRMREALGDVVWAVDPRKDNLSDLVSRVRSQFNALEADGTRVRFVSPPDRELRRLEVSADKRRHLLLI